MAFSQLRIGLEVAKFIFDDVEFTEMTIGGKIAGYKAKFKDYEYEDKAIVHLCKKVWRGNA